MVFSANGKSNRHNIIGVPAPKGLCNFEIADLLGLRSISFGNQRNFLTYSVLGNLIDEGRVVKEGIRYRKTLA